jgi:hypothetical protein
LAKVIAVWGSDSLARLSQDAAAAGRAAKLPAISRPVETNQRLLHIGPLTTVERFRVQGSSFRVRFKVQGSGFGVLGSNW